MNRADIGSELNTKICPGCERNLGTLKCKIIECVAKNGFRFKLCDDCFSKEGRLEKLIDDIEICVVQYPEYWMAYPDLLTAIGSGDFELNVDTELSESKRCKIVFYSVKISYAEYKLVNEFEGI
jgi:hypothetical protein